MSSAFFPKYNMVMEQGKTEMFVPHVKTFIDTLLVNVQRVGLTTGHIKVHQPKSGALNDGSKFQMETLLDRFKLSIPYACSSLKWEFIFQSNSKAIPPDFIFEDSTFDPDIRKLRSLQVWDGEFPNSFSDLVRELIDEYKKEQMSLLAGQGQVKIEIEALLQNTEITNDDIEVHVDSKGRSNAVNVVIQLPIDFSCIPEVYTMDIEEKCIVVLFIRYTENSRVMSHILASPELEGEQYFSLLGINNLQIPMIVNGYTLSEYVLTVTEFIKEKISAVVNSYQKRLDFVSAFVTLYKKNVLEYDGEMFTLIALLVDSKDFYFNVLISLSPCFPEEPPIIKCSSNYHITSGYYGKPFSKEYKNCPYSPRWQPAEMAERYWKFISEKADVFKNASLNF